MMEQQVCFPKVIVASENTRSRRIRGAAETGAAGSETNTRLRQTQLGPEITHRDHWKKTVHRNYVERNGTSVGQTYCGPASPSSQQTHSRESCLCSVINTIKNIHKPILTYISCIYPSGPLLCATARLCSPVFFMCLWRAV